MIIKMIMILHHIFFEYFSSPPSLCSFLPFSLYFYFPRLFFSLLLFFCSLVSSPLLFFSLLLFSTILFSSRLLYFSSFLHSQYVSPSINPSSQTNFSTILKSHLPFFFSFFLILSSAPQCLNNNSGDVPKL